jgi:hypothetical protein
LSARDQLQASVIADARERADQLVAAARQGASTRNGSRRGTTPTFVSTGRPSRATASPSKRSRTSFSRRSAAKT